MVSRHHLLGWQALRGTARVVAIADPVQAHAHARASEFGIDAVFADARTMLESVALDAVDIVSPRETHVELVRLAAARGLAVLCQKPLAPTLAEATDLVGSLGAGTRLMVHENWRFRPYYRQIAQWLRADVIGNPRTVQMTMLSSALVPNDAGRLPALERQPFMATEPRMLVNELLIHHLDVLRFLLGPLEVVSATLRRYCANIVGEDSALIHLQSAGGALVTLLGSMAAAGYSSSTVDRFDISAERGSIRLSDYALTRTGTIPETMHYDPAESYQAAYDRTIAHFVEALATGAPFETDPRDNLQTLRLVEDVYTLADRRGVVV
ncbi:MAG TPA: Gfo/Idh/MocA family oxidoreductase [Steroidobacter sp.]|nr:Gfo/Idh/MocA family oxidoreductase [Steroidobacter sp.]